MESGHYSKEFLLDLYRSMILQRRFEIRVGEFFKAGKIYGITHLSLGQEAVEVGACKALRPSDQIVSTHRGHGHILGKGADPGLMLAELFGRENGYCRGRGGSMHVTDAELGILGTNGIVGAGFPVACGSALASKYRGDGAVTVCFFGDGATNHGTFHECLNMAATWDLPILFFCENNGYAISVPIESVTNTRTLAERAAAYGIPGIYIDTNDVLDVYEAVSKYAELAREGRGPALIECLTYRHSGHNYNDTAAYRPESYMVEAKENDGIAKFEKYLLAHDVTQKELDVICEETDEVIGKAAEFAENSPFPDPATAWDYVYSSDNERCIRR